MALTLGDCDKRTDELCELAKRDDPLAHLLAILDYAAELMLEFGGTADALVIESHRAQLVAGREWPGDRIVSPFPPELEAVS